MMSLCKFFVKGIKVGVVEVMRNFDEILKKIQLKKYILQKLGIGKYLKGDNGKSIIKKIEKEYKCYIYIVEEDVIFIVSVFQLILFNGVMVEYKIKFGIFIRVYEGDLIVLCVDVIVNGVNVDFKYQGGLVFVLVKKGK